ncbi:hypothetical protein [Nonomuraea composti]|uniref:hypothetical protein n=1 Tax=Nonomuraea composti TaxID=2720023 RepID=UPI003204EA41
MAALDSHDTPMVVITGGEPLLHQSQPGWTTLLDALAARGRRIEVETNGTVLPDTHTLDVVTRFNVSPKLAHSEVPAERRIVPAALSLLALSGKADFKFVCRGPDDVEAAARIAVVHGIPQQSVWIMPEGRTREALSKVSARVAPRALELRLNFTPRLHIDLWGNERGR